MKKRLLFSLIPALACLAFATPALATSQVGVSENWAGYVVTSNDGSDFSAASGQWTVPSVTCTANSQPTYSAYWVGLGGGSSDGSEALEQIGTQADCSASGKTTFYAWYELVPSAPVKLSLSIHEGDSIWARTAVSADKVSLYIRDRTTNRTWTRTLTMSSATPDTSTAEWVAEAPSECASSTMSDCTTLPLANFGTVKFTDAYTTSSGHTGSIGDSRWTAEELALEPASSDVFGGGPGGSFQGGFDGDSTYSSYITGSSGAAPSSLSNDGTTFRVKYGASLEAQGTGTTASESGSNPYGYGGSGYYGGSGGYGYYGGYGGYGYYGGWGY
jgi:Peptidase A4 family